MRNNDTVLTRDDIRAKLQQAIKDGDTQEFQESFELMLENIRDVQTIITCTGLDDFVNSHFSIDQVYHVSGGSVIKETS